MSKTSDLAQIQKAEKELQQLETAYADLATDASLTAASMAPPPFGTAADVVSIGRSLWKGDWGGALLDVVGVIPIVGDAVKGASKGTKIAAKMKQVNAAIKAAKIKLARIKKGLSASDAKKTKDATTDAARNCSVQRCPKKGGGGKNADAPILKGRRPKNPEHSVKNEDGSLTEYGKWYYERPSGYRKGVRKKAFDNAKGSDQKVRDPLTKEEIKFNDEWNMGHKPKHEFKKHKADAAKREIDRKEFLDEHNKPENYRPETPNTNRSHKLEDVTDAFE